RYLYSCRDPCDRPPHFPFYTPNGRIMKNIYCLWESLGTPSTKLEFILSWILGILVFPLSVWLRTGDDIVRFSNEFIVLNTLSWTFIVSAALLFEWQRRVPLYLYAFNTTAIFAAAFYLPAKWLMDGDELIPLTTVFIMVLLWTPLIHLKERVLFY